MPKLRNGKTDVEKFTQWLARKCRNHNPLQELKLPSRARERTPNIYQSKTRGALRIARNEGENNVVLYTAGNRTFAIHVEEITGQDQVAPLYADSVEVL